ncbi:MAG TPA: hypothetical protein VGN72_17195 [Tepidisphaeraceae bacterium]|jgi:L-ascorbate metabolism protein UlaG (beta-lactamase superfamily)|nr:hypothetical protein [Tepidisphaeraceae bacterium]
MNQPTTHPDRLRVRLGCVALVTLLGLNAALPAQSLESPAVAPLAELLTPATRPANAYVLSDAELKHLERQTQVSLEQVAAALEAHPPAVDAIPRERAMALTLFDTILHDPAAPQRASVGQFRQARTKQAIDDMLRTTVTEGAVVWQIYNMGFVVRTRSVTIGFDLVKLVHVPVISLDDETMRALIDQCDVLFVSHEHLDHADREVSQWFLDAGKPVVAPPAMWLGEPSHARLTHLPRDGRPQGHSLSIRDGKATLQVAVYPGAQRTKEPADIENNVYVITTPEGIRIAHTGDNNVTAGLPKAGSLNGPIDLLLMKLEPGNGLRSKRIVNAFDPRLTLPSHFEELGHANVNGREPFWRGMERVPKLKVPTLMMMWGERYHYRPLAN